MISMKESSPESFQELDALINESIKILASDLIELEWVRMRRKLTLIDIFNSIQIDFYGMEQEFNEYKESILNNTLEKCGFDLNEDITVDELMDHPNVKEQFLDSMHLLNESNEIVTRYLLIDIE